MGAKFGTFGLALALSCAPSAACAGGDAVLDLGVTVADDHVVVALYNAGTESVAVGPLVYGQSTSDLVISATGDGPRPDALPNKDTLKRWAARRFLSPNEFVGVRIPVSALVRQQQEKCRELTFSYSYSAQQSNTRSRDNVTRRICR